MVLIPTYYPKLSKWNYKIIISDMQFVSVNEKRQYCRRERRRLKSELFGRGYLAMEERVDLKVIDGVEIKELVTHSDERGFFREIIRVTDDFFDEGFGQWSCAMRSVGTGEWHMHEQQTDWWHVPIGEMQAYLYDNRSESVTYQERDMYVLDSSYVLKIPPGVAHAFKILLPPVHLFYITSHIYNPADEGRIPYSDIGLTE